MKMILIAASEISARFLVEKGGKAVKQTIDSGTHITPALAKKFGLSADDIESLTARGHIVERSAHVVAEGDGPSAADLAEAVGRAEAAEARVAELTAELEAAIGEGDDLAEKLKVADARIAELEKAAKPATAAKA